MSCTIYVAQSGRQSEGASHITHNPSLAWHLEKLTEGNCLVLYESGCDVELHRFLQAACFQRPS